jgi:hypothetical protein
MIHGRHGTAQPHGRGMRRGKAWRNRQAEDRQQGEDLARHEQKIGARIASVHASPVTAPSIISTAARTSARAHSSSVRTMTLTSRL